MADTSTARLGGGNGGARPLSDFGIHLRAEKAGEHRAPCPECAKGPRDDALAVKVEPDGRATWFCHRCGWKGCTEAPGARHEGFRPSPKLVRAVETEAPSAELTADAARLWRECRALTTDSPVVAYLRGRGCPLPRNAVRWHPAHRHRCGYVGPCMVALVTDAVTDRPMTLHRTWLAPGGTGKAPIDKPRLLWPGLPKAGGVVRLWPDEDVSAGLCVAEGIETALAAAAGFGLAWAAIDAGNLAALPVLEGIEALTIIEDHDKAGIEAAAECGRRWADAGREVRTWRAQQPKADFADFLAGIAA